MPRELLPVGLTVEVVTAGNIPVPRGIYSTHGPGHRRWILRGRRAATGDYVVGINLLDLPNPGVPYTRLLFPGRTNPGDRDGESRRTRRSRYLAAAGPGARWVVSGVVTWEDGRPAERNRGPRARRHRRPRIRLLGRARRLRTRTAALPSGCGRDTATASWPHRPRTELMLVAAPALDARRPPAFTAPHRHSPGAGSGGPLGPPSQHACRTRSA